MARDDAGRTQWSGAVDAKRGGVGDRAKRRRQQDSLQPRAQQRRGREGGGKEGRAGGRGMREKGAGAAA